MCPRGSGLAFLDRISGHLYWHIEVIDIYYLFVLALELVLEESPKWKVLRDVLEDIDKENTENRSGIK